MMRSQLFVYLSGPITPKRNALAEDHVAAALRVYLELIAAGVPCFCPQLGAAFPSAWTRVTYAQWLSFDLAVIDRCTHVLMLDGWESSSGACVEKAYAEGKQIPIVYSLGELLTEDVPL